MADEALIEQMIGLSIADAEQQAGERLSRRDSILNPEDEIIIIRRSGQDNIDEIFYIDENRNPCKLVMLRISFDQNGQSAPFGTATLRIFTHSEHAEEYNCQLWRIALRGPHAEHDADVFLRNEHGAIKDPSPWSVPRGSGFRITWQSPNANYKWGIEIGLARTK